MRQYSGESDKHLEMESRIHWLEQEITKEYARIGRMLSSIVETESRSINEMTDEVVRLKELLTKH